MADFLRETPMQNPIMGLLADRLKKVQEFGAKPFGYENPPVEMLMNLLGVPAVQQTMERMAYGEPLTTGRGMTTKPRPEAVEAAMTLLPMAAGAAKATKGLPVGASIKNVGEELIYHGTTPKAAKAIEKSGFDVSKSADGTIWFTSNPNIGEVAATGKGAVVKRFLNEKKMKLGGWDETDKYSTDELIQKGFDGLKLVDDDTGEITYQIFNPEKLSVNKSYSYPQQEALDTAQRNAIEYPLAPAGTRYEEFGGELTYMTPDEYLSRVRPLTLDEESLDNIAALKSHVQSGGQLDPLHIYQSGKEDGRHRAYMAKELGIEKIPVALHTEANNLGQNIPLDALSLLAEQKRKEITNLLDY
jgi:hypothetical protein